MKEFQATTLLVALFTLRCIVPLILTLAIGYAMNRIVDRWQAEDEAELETAVTLAAIPGSAAGPTSSSTPKRPCWLVKNCDPAMRPDCPAFRQPGIPCWLARMRAEGVFPADCPTCPVYVQARAAQAW